MNRNKMTKNVKQNKAIDNIIENTKDIKGSKATFNNASADNNK